MRHPYTPVFRDLLTSSLWVTDPATRCVWVWMLLSADPEGYVCATLPGLAQAANVTLDEAKRAVALFEAPDFYSATKELGGRRIVAVERGWHIVNFVARREMAKHEAEKARKRRWAEENRRKTKQLTLPGVDLDIELGPPLSVDEASTFGEVDENVDAPKPKPKSKHSPRKERSGSPLPPAADPFVTELFPEAAPAPVLPTVIRQLGDWHPSTDELAALAAEAAVAGVPDFEARMASLAFGPIGGSRGVLPGKVADYVRSQFGKWRTWSETDRAKAARGAATGSPKRFGGGGASWEPTDAHKRFAERYGLELGAMADAYRRSGEPEQRGALKDADEAFARRLVKAKREREKKGRAA